MAGDQKGRNSRYFGIWIPRGDCSMVKGRKEQHGIGLAIKEETAKKAGKDGIIIECIRARFLKALISNKSNFVTFVVAYAPTEEAP